MHVQAYDAVKRMAQELGLDGYPEAGVGDMLPVGLDIGGANVNGSARDQLGAVAYWQGLDIEAGPGVDIVADATNPGHGLINRYNVVLCTEVLEHVKDWPAIIRTAAYALRPGGIAIFTCAGRGRTPHGARGARRPAEGEHYANVEAEALSWEMRLNFESYRVRYNPRPGDLYAWGRV